MNRSARLSVCANSEAEHKIMLRSNGFKVNKHNSVTKNPITIEH